MEKYYEVWATDMCDNRQRLGLIVTPLSRDILDDVAREMGLVITPTEEPFRFSTTDQDPGKRLQFVREVLKFQFGGVATDAVEEAAKVAAKAAAEAYNDGASAVEADDAGTRVYERLGVAALITIQQATVGRVRSLEENTDTWRSLFKEDRRQVLCWAQEITLAKGRTKR